MRNINRFAFMRAAAAVLAASTAIVVTSASAQTTQTASVASVAPAKAHLGTWGIDLTARDMSVKPGDDFQKYASGTWLTKT